MHQRRYLLWLAAHLFFWFKGMASHFDFGLAAAAGNTGGIRWNG